MDSNRLPPPLPPTNYPRNSEEEERWLTRREEQHSDSPLPPLSSQHQHQQQHDSGPLPYHQYSHSGGYLRQPAPLRPNSQWSQPNLGSSSSSNSTASTSTNSYIPSAQSNSFNQSYQPLPYPSPVSPAFSIPNNNSNNSHPSMLPSSSNSHHQNYQSMSSGSWLPSLPPLKHQHHESESSSQPSSSRERENYSRMYDKNLEQTNAIAQAAILPQSTGTSIGAQTAVKPFAAKLAFLLANPNLYADLIMWDEAGTCFILAHSVERLSEEVLPLLFSHNSSTAFRRQLNIYNFVHLTSQQLTKKFRNSTISVPIKHCSGWQHPYFTKDNPGTLHLLRPKPSRARRLHQLSREKKVLENVMERNKDADARGEREEDVQDYDEDDNDDDD